MDIIIQEIIEGCKNNNRRCQEALYKLYYNKMHSWLMKEYNDIQITEEIINDAFLRVFKGIHLYEYKGSFEGWLRIISKRALYDYIKRHHNYLKKNTLPDKISDNAIYDHPEAKIDYKFVINKMNNLPNKTKSILLMYLDGYTHREIGEAFNITEGTSKWHVSDSKDKLKDMIKELT